MTKLLRCLALASLITGCVVGEDPAPPRSDRSGTHTCQKSPDDPDCDDPEDTDDTTGDTGGDDDAPVEDGPCQIDYTSSACFCSIFPDDPAC